MKNTKRILSILMIIMMLLGSLPTSVFAEEISSVTEESSYEIGEIYTIDGVRYKIDEDETVTVLGQANGMPEKVELLSYLGKYPVTKTSISAFDYNKNLKEIIIPETVTSINGFFRTGLEKIQIKGEYVSVNISVFAYSPFFENEDNWKDGLLIVGSCLIKSKAEGVVILDEEITSVAADSFGYTGKADTIKIYNENCFIPSVTGVFPIDAKLCGKEGSTLQQYVEKFTSQRFEFENLCLCDDTQLIEETPTLCDGTLGYAEGRWCEKCQVWQSGHRKNETVRHFDKNSDKICDNCKTSLDKKTVDSGIVGDNAFWFLDDNGTLTICGTGDVYSYSASDNEPWYRYKNDIKAVVAVDGICRLHGISFENYENLETVDMPDSILSMPSSFENCVSLRDIDFFASFSAIPSHCFAGCEALESIYIPKNIIKIGTSAFRNCKNLKSINFETGYLDLESDAFYGTAAYNNPDNIKEGFLYIDNCLIKEMTPGATSVVLGPEITSIASGWEDFAYSKVTEVVVYNTECSFPGNSGAVPIGAILKGFVGSTAWNYSKKFGVKFEPVEPHSHTEVIDIPAVAPTSTEPGYTHQSHCSVCGEIVVKRELISHGEYDISFDGDEVIAQKFDAATSETDGADIVITFALRNNVYTSNIDKTVIYKVGEVKLSKTEFTYNGRVQKPDVTVKDSKGETLVLNRDYKIKYSANSKYSGKHSVTVNYIGNYAGSVTLNYSIIINAVTPMVEASTTESITLSWTQGHSDLVYRVYSVDSKGELTKIADTKNGNYEITSLEADTQYKFQVRAYVKGDDGKTYWGEKGAVITCATKSNKGIINWLRNIIARFKAIIQKIFRITK